MKFYPRLISVLIAVLLVGVAVQQVQAIEIRCPGGVMQATQKGNDIIDIQCIAYTPTAPVLPSATFTPSSTPTSTPSATSTSVPTVLPTATSLPTPAPTVEPTVAPVSGVVPLAERHPDAGIWVVYPNSNVTIAQLRQPWIKGAMSWNQWEAMWTGPNRYNWNKMRADFDRIINQAGKKAFVDISAGYCPNNPWPAPLRATVAERKTASGFLCPTLQFWDPVYLSQYKTFIRAFAEELARFDSTDANPKQTDILYVRAAEMGQSMETLVNSSEIKDFTAATFNPAPNGRIYSVNLTSALMYDYYEAVLDAYRTELNRAYAAVGLSPPAQAAANSGATHWNYTPAWPYIQKHNLLLDSHNTTPNTQSSYYDFYVGTQALTNRAASESGGWWTRSQTWLGQWAYWELLNNLHHGVEFLGVYGNTKAFPTLQPTGHVFWPPNQEAMLFGDRYAGEHRNPATAPGVWIAFRGYYPEKWYGSANLQAWTNNYEGGLTQANVPDSKALYGFDHSMEDGMINPLVERSAVPNWAAELAVCLLRYGIKACEAMSQPPDVTLPMAGTKRLYTYAVTDLGRVQTCGGDLFCTVGTVTRSEPMPWARQTLGTAITLDTDDAFAKSLKGPVSVRVVYLDQDRGRWALQVDGTTRLSVQKAGTNLWREVLVTVPAGALNIQLDPLDDGDDIFHMVEVTRLR